MLVTIGSEQTPHSKGCLPSSEIQIEIYINLPCRSKAANMDKRTENGKDLN